jgi:hypothetical protein
MKENNILSVSDTTFSVDDYRHFRNCIDYIRELNDYYYYDDAFKKNLYEERDVEKENNKNNIMKWTYFDEQMPISYFMKIGGTIDELQQRLEKDIQMYSLALDNYLSFPCYVSINAESGVSFQLKYRNGIQDVNHYINGVLTDFKDFLITLRFGIIKTETYLNYIKVEETLNRPNIIVSDEYIVPFKNQILSNSYHSLHGTRSMITKEDVNRYLALFKKGFLSIEELNKELQEGE